MAKQFHILFFLLILITSSRGQNAAPPQNEHYTTNTDYKDFIIIERQIWALTIKGGLKVFDLKNGEPLEVAPRIDSPILAIAKDEDSTIALAFNGKIASYNKSKKTWSYLGSYDDAPMGIIFNSAKECFLITSKGIQDLNSGKTFFPDSSLNHQINYRGRWFKSPTFYMDHDDNIWIGFGFGEWGGDLFIFDTKKRKFIVPNMGKYDIDLNPVKSIFSDDSIVYISTGVAHFGNSGSIVSLKHFLAEPLFTSSYGKGKDNTIVQGEYIGPATFNRSDHCIYFYAQNGIFKGDPDKDISAIEQWEKVASPKLLWSNGQQDAVGSPMNVFKMEFADSKTLVFVTQLNGLGIYNGETITLVK